MPKITEIIGDPNSVHIDWTVSNVCNYDCRYCFGDAKNGSWSWPDLYNVQQTLEQLLAHYGNKTFFYTLLGGELTLWKQFDQFIELLHSITPGCKIKLLTNGRMPESYWQKWGSSFSAIQFSYHAAQTDTQEFVNSINACSCPNINVFVMMDKLHWDKCCTAYEQIVQQCSTVRTVSAKPIDNRAELYTTTLQSYTDNQLEWMKQARYYNSSIRLPPFSITHAEYDTGIIEEIDPMRLILDGNNHWQGWKCSIGIEKLALRMDGEITRASGCEVGREQEIGNWRTSSIIQLPVDWVTCPMPACFCGNDIGVSRKIKQ